MKHASIDPNTRVPKNCKYTELELYFTLYVYVGYFMLLCVILINIQSSQPSRGSRSLLKTGYL